MNKQEILDISKSIDEALEIGTYDKDYAKTLIKTNIFLRQKLKGVNDICKDCNHELLKEEYRETSEGVTLCEECIIVAEANAKADWDTKESARGYPYNV